MIAVLLAAGAGAKMWPAAETRNKATLPVGNVPAVRRLADDLLSLGIDGLVVGVGAHAASVRHALHGLPDAKVRFVDVSRENGTAPAALRCHADAGIDGDFLVVYGDIVCPRENLAELLRVFGESGAPAAALTAALGAEEPYEWIGAKVEDGRLVGVVGHMRDPLPRLCGVTAFRPAALPALRDNPGVVRHVPVGGMPPVESEIAESLALMIDDGLPVAAALCPEFYVDLDKPWHVLEANFAWVRYAAARVHADVIPASCRIDDGAEISGRLVLGENVVIGKRAVIRGTLFAGDNTSILNGPILQGDVVLGRDVSVRDYCLLEGGTVCGDRGVYGHGSEFCGTALDNVYLYHYCEIFGLLGSSVDIGAATVCGTLRFDDREARHRVRGRVEVPRVAANASYLGDYVRTGVNAILMPGCKAGAWSCVGPGVVLQEDLPSRQAVFVRQQLERRDWGPEKYGW